MLTNSKSLLNRIFFACLFLTRPSLLTAELQSGMRLSPFNRAIFSVADRVKSGGINESLTSWTVV